MKRVVSLFGSVSIILGLTACTTMPDPSITQVEVRPKAPPMRTLTNFSEALGCMDNMFLQHNTKFVITSNGLPDATGEVSMGTKEMMITAIGNMSVKSKAFTFVDYDQNNGIPSDVNALYALIGGAAGPAAREKFRVPEQYIRGAITQIDKNVLQDSTSGGLEYMGGGGGGGGTTCDMGPSGPTNCKPKGGGGGNIGGGIGFNEQASSAVVSVDTNIVDMVSRQIMPGMSSSNSVIFTSSGNGLNVDATIKKVGLNFSTSMSRNEGIGAAVRSLIELAMIESLGKLARVPYWKCLGQDSTSSDLLAKTRKDYDDMMEEERIKLVQGALMIAGYPNISVTGILDESTKESVSNYKKDNNLIANGRIDFDLYYNLVTKKYISPPMGAEKIASVDNILDVEHRTRAIPKLPIAIKMSSNKGENPTLKVGEDLRVTVGLSQTSFLYCYYQDSKGSVSRIFPNRFTPNAAVMVENEIKIPPAALPFKLVMDTPGNSDRIDCIASRSDVDVVLPKELKTIDLQPMPVQTVEDVINAFRKLDPGIVSATLHILVSS